MSESSFLPTLDAETRSNIPSSEVATASGSSDPASSLRAAALLTLKSKRRKPPLDSSQTLPSRPPPSSDAGFQLDYGQEDITSSPPSAVASEAPSILLKPPPAEPATDDQIREEGEISDEEIIQPPTNPLIPDSPKQPPLSPLVTNLEPFARPTPPRSAVPSALEQSLPGPKLSDRISDPPSSSFTEDTAMLVDHLLVGDLPLHLIDADHVRPGLPLNQSQYDTAKDIVLDLLGWGVPPEYLVDCGLTREIVFYVFSELNLRLPQNLDITGLLPYTPEVKSLVERHQSPLIPPPSHPPRRLSQGHPSLPSKPQLPDSPSPQASQDSAVTTSPTRSIAKPATEAPHVPSSNNLHDMEQQRRQELLARKAVIASRKSKMLASTGAFANAESALVVSLENPESHTNGHDVEMAVPTETVDDFLKSIGPNPESTPTIGQSTPVDTQTQQRQMDGDDMDVDEIPGLASSRSFQLSPNTISDEQASSDPTEHHMIISPTLSATNSMSQLEYPPSSTESTKTTFNTQFPTADSSFLSESQSLQRRGTKRPVASDFVDFETAPRPHSSSNGGYSNGGPPTNPPSRNALGNGFASASGMRRCVIDLSDSEGEDGEDVVGDVSGNSKDKWGRRSGFVSPAPIRPTVTTLASASRWTPPPVSAVALGFSAMVSASGGTMSPAALMEKEIEIRKMRELIAQREQNRLKKVTSTRSMSTIDGNVASNTPHDTASVPPKQEAPDFPPSSSITENDVGGDTNGRQHSPAQSTHPLQQVSQLASPSSSGTATIDTHNGDNISVDSNISTGEPVLTAEVRHEQAVNSFSTQADTELRSGNESPPSGSVDVDPASSSSAQVSPKITSAHQRLDESQDLSVASLPTPREDRQNEDYVTYDSPFQWYPLLSSRSRPLFSDNIIGLQASPLSSSLSFNSTSSTSSLSFTSDSSLFPMPPSSSPASLFPYSPSTHPSHISTFLVPNLKPLKLAMVFKQLDPLKRICQYEVPGGGVCRDEGCDDVHLNRIGLGTSGLELSDQDTSDYLVNTLPSAWLDEHGVSQSKISSALQQIRLKNPQIAFEERVAQALATLGPPALPAPTPK